MKSSIKIDFIDRGTGRGIEPVIRAEVIKSEDPRDTLISHLFQSLQGESFLQIEYSNHKHIAREGLPDMEKTVLLFKPEMNGHDSLSYRVMDNCTAFHDFLKENEIDFTPDGHYTIVRDTKYGAFLLGQKLQAYKVGRQERESSQIK